MYNLSNASLNYDKNVPFVSGISIQPPPPTEQGINIRAAQIAGALDELNDQLATLRAKLFGEGEANPIKAKGEGPMPSVAGCLCDCEALLQSAHGQLSSILNRL